ncbi:MAG: hypothetical protein R2991_02400 [Thermoanaerobaculia bacterium]
MSRPRSPWLALVALLLVTLPAAAQFGDETTEPLIPLTLPELLDNYYDAIGGLEAWDALETVKVTGKMTMGPGLEAPFTLYHKLPEKMRLEFEVQGMTGVQALDGDQGWMYLPFMGRTEAEPMPEEMAAEFRKQVDLAGPLVHWQDKGHEVELEGVEQVEGTEAYKLKVTLAPSGDVRYYYLDSEYFIPIKMTGKTEIQGSEADFEVTLSDYKEVEGTDIMMPHSIEQRQVGAPGGQTITIEDVEVGVDIPDSQFEMPAAAPAAAEDEAAE